MGNTNKRSRETNSMKNNKRRGSLEILPVYSFSRLEDYFKFGNSATWQSLHKALDSLCSEWQVVQSRVSP